MDGMTINHIVSIDHGSYGCGDPHSLEQTFTLASGQLGAAVQPGSSVNNEWKLSVHMFPVG